MNNPQIDIKTEKAQEVINLYKEIDNVNLRRLSHTDWDNVDFWEQKKIYLQIQFDSNKQRELFAEIIGMPEEYISDVLVKALQDDVNKDTLWRLFGEVIYHNIEKNLSGTKICKKCGNRFHYDTSIVGKPSSLCASCRNQNQLEKYRRYNQNR